MVLLLMTLLDFAVTLIPMQFRNPAWELQVMGRYVDVFLAPLLGFFLLFLPLPVSEVRLRNRWLLQVARWSSWLALGLGAMYLCFIPFLLVDSYRLVVIANRQLATQLQQQQVQVVRVVERLQNLSPQGLAGLLGEQAQARSPEVLRQELLGQVQVSRDQARSQLEQGFAGRRIEVLKSGVRWAFGALLAGIVLIYQWHDAAWLRRVCRERKD